MALVYAAIQLIGMSFFGIETWEDRADGFQTLWSTYARLSPFHRHGRDLWVRPPLNGAPRRVGPPAAEGGAAPADHPGHRRAARDRHRHDELRRLLERAGVGIARP